MTKPELSDFLPYILNQAAELVSREFQHIYKDRYGMLRIEWRVLFHLGSYGDITAKQICAQSGLHKTKVSRAVVALERKRFVTRKTFEADRRFETLSLTRQGLNAFHDLAQSAAEFERHIENQLGADEVLKLKETLQKLRDSRTPTPQG